MYDETTNNFGTKIKGRVYDITGDVTDNYSWMSWVDISDDECKEKIIIDRIMF